MKHYFVSVFILLCDILSGHYSNDYIKKKQLEDISRIYYWC